jgi:hypothetical protein
VGLTVDRRACRVAASQLTPPPQGEYLSVGDVDAKMTTAGMSNGERLQTKMALRDDTGPRHQLVGIGGKRDIGPDPNSRDLAADGLKKKIHALHMTRDKAAKMVGVNRATMQRYMSGRCAIPIGIANSVDRELLLQELWQMVHAVQSDQHVRKSGLTEILLQHGPRHLRRDGKIERRGRPPLPRPMTVAELASRKPAIGRR